MFFKKSSVLFLVLFTLISFVSSLSAKEIVVGITAPFSGPAAEYGNGVANAIDMAIKDVNASGGISVKGEKCTFKILRMDDRNDPAQSVANAKKFRSEGAIAVFSPTFASIAELAKINQQKGTEFLIMAYTSTPKAAELGNRLLLVTATPFNVAAHAFANAAWENKWRKAAMIVTAGSYGDEWKQTFKAYWQKKGGSIVFDKSANYYKELDFSAYLKEAIAAKPDFMLVGGPSPTTALLIEQARKLGFTGGFVLIDQASMAIVSKMHGGNQHLKDAIGVSSATAFAFPALAEFEKKYTMNYKKPVTSEVSRNYNAMQALARAIAAAGNADDVQAIRAAFPKAFPMLGDKFPTEVYGLSAKGNFFTTTSMQEMTAGKYSDPVSLVWYPKSQADFNQILKITKSPSKPAWVKSLD